MECVRPFTVCKMQCIEILQDHHLVVFRHFMYSKKDRCCNVMCFLKLLIIVVFGTYLRVCCEACSSDADN